MKILTNQNETNSFSQYEELDKNRFTNRIYWMQYFQIIWLGLLFLLLLSVLTYNPSDDSFLNFSSKGHQYSNSIGFIGANISDLLYNLFGLPALIFSLMFLFLQLALFQIPKPESRLMLRFFGFPQFVVFYCGLFSSIQTKMFWRGIQINSGGLIGAELHSFLTKYLNETGCIVLLSIGVLSSLTLCLGVKPISTISFFLSFVTLGKSKTLKEKMSRMKDSAENTYQENQMTFSTIHENEIQNEDDNPSLPEPSFVSPLQSKYISKSDFHVLLSFLENSPKTSVLKSSDKKDLALQNEGQLIQEKLLSFGVEGTVVSSQAGPVIHVHEFEPASGVKVNKVMALQDDLTLALKAKSLMMNLYGGKNTISIEIPSPHRELITLKEILETEQFQNKNCLLNMALGKNVDGSLLISDLFAMPHLLIAGSTGSGKSVCVNAILLSLMISKTPTQLRLLLIDPKMLELSCYDNIGHLLMPVITNPFHAAAALKYLVMEMEKRYARMKQFQVRSLPSYNELMEKENKETLPHIVVVVDELCDLMMCAPKDVEESIQRLAQKARAAGIHLILATQRPSVDVLTGVIKANLPCRISFQVASRHDSRTIIEGQGAERLLGKGDMLFLNPETRKMQRAQCAFVSDREINTLSDKLRSLYTIHYETDMIREIERVSLDYKSREKKGSAVPFGEVPQDHSLTESL